MKHQTAPATRRGRPLPDDAFPAHFVRHAYMLAIRRAARDAHRSECDLDVVGCDICRERARAIAEAKRALNQARHIPT
jgi:hypothetical protein